MQSGDRNDGSLWVQTRRGRKECDVKGPKSSFDAARARSTERASEWSRDFSLRLEAVFWCVSLHL